MSAIRTVRAAMRAAEARINRTPIKVSVQKERLILDIKGYGETSRPDSRRPAYMHDMLQNTVDAICWMTVKGIVSGAEAGEAVRYLVSKGFTDAAAAVDAVSCGLLRHLSPDGAVSSDLLRLEPTKAFSELSATTEINRFGLLKMIADQVVISESFSLNRPSEPLSDLSSAIETFSKGLTTALAGESVGSSDSLTVSLLNRFLDNTLMSDSMSAYVVRVLIDSAGSSDTLTSAIGKMSDTTAISSDRLDTLAVFNRSFGDTAGRGFYASLDYFQEVYLEDKFEEVRLISSKVLADLSAVTDVSALNIEVLTVDWASLAETVRFVSNSHRHIQDYAEAIDDFDGNLTTEDNQTAYLNKTVLEYPEIVELIFNSISTSKADGATLADLFSSVVSTGKLDAVTMSEGMSVATDKEHVDSVSLSDAIELLISMQHAVEDSVAATSVVNSRLNKAAEEGCLVDELFASSSNIVLLEGGYFGADYVTRSYNLGNVSDLLFTNLHTNLVDVGSLADALEAAMNKTTTELANIIESVAVLGSTKHSDLTTIAESLSLHSSKLQSDVASLSESIVMVGDYKRGPADNISTSEMITIERVRSLEEWISAFDVSSILINRHASTETATVGDLITIVHERDFGLNETVSTSETFSTNKQNYLSGRCIIPGYVGFNTGN